MIKDNFKKSISIKIRFDEFIRLNNIMDNYEINNKDKKKELRFIKNFKKKNTYYKFIKGIK